jgi:hypothetical protein
MMTEEMNVIHAQRWWRLRDSLRAASIPPSLDGARRRPPVPPLCRISPRLPSGCSNPDRLLIAWRAVDDVDPSRQGPVR